MGEVELLRTRTCQHPPAGDEDDTPAHHREAPNRGIWQGRTEDDDDDESDELDDDKAVDSPPCSERRSKQSHDPAGGHGKAAAPSTQAQKRVRTLTLELTKKVAKQPKIAPSKARKTLPKIKMDLPVSSG